MQFLYVSGWSVLIINALTEQNFSRNFFRNKNNFQNLFRKNFPKTFLGNFKKKKFRKRFPEMFPARPHHNPGTGTPASHAANPSGKPLSGTPFVPVQTIPNPGPVRAPIPRFSGTEPDNRPDWDPPTPCLVRKSWKIFTNRGSGGSFHVDNRRRSVRAAT
jgi:hypothetical protein